MSLRARRDVVGSARGAGWPGRHCQRFGDQSACGTLCTTTPATHGAWGTVLAELPIWNWNLESICNRYFGTLGRVYATRRI
jgi:hypothetical protein